MLRRALAALLLAAAAAGCAAPPPEDGRSAGPKEPQAFGGLGYTQWDGCRGAATFFDLLPPGFALGTPPPGWEPDALGTAEVSLRLVDCKRVHWGPFERPARMVWELHDNLDPPPRCDEGRRGFLYAVSQVFVSDPELARFLAEEHGLRAWNATIEVAETSDGARYGQTWTWTPEGAAASTVTIGDAGLDNGRLAETDRIAWDNGSGVTLLDLTSEYAQRSAGQTPNHGTMRPPMLWAQLARDYAGQGGATPDETDHGPVTRYADHACTAPVTS